MWTFGSEWSPRYQIYAKDPVFVVGSDYRRRCDSALLRQCSGLFSRLTGKNGKALYP